MSFVMITMLYYKVSSNSNFYKNITQHKTTLNNSFQGSKMSDHFETMLLIPFYLF